MGIQVKLKFNKDKILSSEIKVIGVSGDACLLLTKAFRDLNPNAAIQNTAEMYDEDDNLVQKGTLTNQG